MTAKSFPAQTYTIDELSELTGLSRRTIRRYIHERIVEHPHGVTSNARYGPEHLQKFLEIKRLSDQGLTLKQIRAELANRSGKAFPFGISRDDDVTVRFVKISDQVAIAFLQPLSLTPEQERRFLKGTRSLYQEVVSK